MGRAFGSDEKVEEYCEPYFCWKSFTASERLLNLAPPCPTLRARAASVALLLGALR